MLGDELSTTFRDYASSYLLSEISSYTHENGESVDHRKCMSYPTPTQSVSLVHTLKVQGQGGVPKRCLSVQNDKTCDCETKGLNVSEESDGSN